MPHARSGCPAEGDCPGCGSVAAGPRPRPTSRAPRPSPCAGTGGAAAPVLRDDGRGSGASGSIAIAGLCWTPAPPIATCSVVSTPAPSAGADRSSTTAAPIDEQEHLRFASHQERGAPARVGHHSPRWSNGGGRAATIIRPMPADPAFAPVPAEPDHVALEHARARALGPRRHVRAAAQAERRRADVLVHRRADHGEQPDGRASRLGALAEGPVPALPRGARRGSALPERLRLPGPVGRGRGREVARPQLEARDRGLRARPLRARVPRPRGRVLGRADARSRAGSACGWTGSGRTSR